MKATDRTFGSLLQELGRTLDVRLTADAESAGERVTLLLSERPVRECLEITATQLGGEWHRAGMGYELRRPTAQRRREREQREGELVELRTWISSLKTWLTVNADVLTRERDVRNRLVNDQTLPRPERSEAQANRDAIDQVLHDRESAAFTVRLAENLPESVWAQLAKEGELQLSGRGASLPAALEAAIYGLVERTRGLRATAPPGRRQTRLLLSLVHIGRDMGEAFGPPVRRGRRLRLRVRLRGEVHEDETGAFEFSWIVPRRTEPEAERPGPPYAPELRREVDLELGTGRPGQRVTWQPSGVTGHPAALGAAGVLWPEWPTLGEVAKVIHAKCGLSVAADGFTPLRMDPHRLAGKRPVGEIFDELARELDLTWSYTGGVVRLESRLRYLDRYEEVPARTLSSWRARVLRQRRITLDDLANLVLSLSGPQVRSLEQHWGWYLAGTGIASPGWLYAYRPHLRFWTTLNPAQRNRLAIGERLKLEEMPPAQRAAWWTAWDAPPATRDTYVPFAGRDEEGQRAARTFGLGTGEFRQRMFISDGSGPEPTAITRTVPASLVGVLVGPEGTEARGPELRMDAYTLRYHMEPARPGHTDGTRSIRIYVPRIRFPEPR